MVDIIVPILLIAAGILLDCQFLRPTYQCGELRVIHEAHISYAWGWSATWIVFTPLTSKRARLNRAIFAGLMAVKFRLKL